MITLLIIFMAAIALSELVLWLIFEKRVRGLHLHLASTTRKRIFTLARIRLLAILHTGFVIATSLFSILLAW